MTEANEAPVEVITKTCPAQKCTKSLDDSSHFMCANCWKMVSRKTREWVAEHWGQDTGDALEAQAAAVHEAAVWMGYVK